MKTRIFSLRHVLSKSFNLVTNIPTDINNALAGFNGENLLFSARVPNANLGLQFWGYLAFKNFLDNQAEKIKIPLGITQIKIDVGLSIAAPNSALWLENLPGRIVFGFEPNPENVRELLTNNIWRRGQYHYLNLKYLNKRFFLFNAAIDNCLPQLKAFYMTRDDPGTSSLIRPKKFKIKKQILVPCFRLADFLALIPWDKFHYIEHIKTDTQGNDLRVLQSAGDYLSKRVVFVTAECTANGYVLTQTKAGLDAFMKKQGFRFIQGTEKGGNKTYINQRFRSLLTALDYSSEGL